MRTHKNFRKRRAGLVLSAPLLSLVGAACHHASVTPAPDRIQLSVSSVVPQVIPADTLSGIQIFGTGFLPGATVTLGTAATNVRVINDTLIHATAPARSVGTADVVVTNPDGLTCTLPGALSFVAFGVLSISPTSGLGGDVARITGVGFLSGVSVSIGGVAAAVVERSGSSLTVIVPAHAPGTADVVVSNSTGSREVLSSGFTYGAVTLSINHSVVAPRSQLTVGWTAPSGRPAFDWIGIFKVGTSNEAYGVYQYTGGAATGTLTFTAPAEPGEYEFRYLVDDGPVDVARSKTVTVTTVPPTPLSVTSVFPSTGPTDSIVDIRIVGGGFRAGTTVTLGHAATDLVVYGAGTSVGARVPPHPAGVVSVVVTNPDGARVTLPNAYTFVPLTVAGLEPVNGLAGDTITLTGSGFATGVGVTFGGVAASIIRRTANVIEAIVPVQVRGVTDVEVKNAGAAAGVIVPGGFAYGVVSVASLPRNVAPGGTLVIRWTSPPGRSSEDWISLYRRGDPRGSYRWYAHTGGLATGEFVLTAPARPGQYEFRYMTGATTVVASKPVVVSGVASPSSAAGSVRER